MNRGSVHSSGRTLDWGNRRFNEAPIHESGKSERIVVDCSIMPTSFNEAPIHESGKWAGTASARGPPRARFNEAPIHESGKCTGELKIEPIEHASMRPRFMNRGSHRPRRLCADSRTRFNEAPIHESGKSRRGRSGSARSDCFNEAPIHESGKCCLCRVVLRSNRLLQ